MAIDSILKQVLQEIKPSAAEMKEINLQVKEFLARIEKNRKSQKINAEIFIGGSEAKETMIKKDSYDIDVFVRFDKKYKEELLSDMTEKILKGERAERIHGSRDYFKIKAKEGLFFEVIPVRKIGNPKEAENITDLSYSHVAYIKKKMKGEILDQVMIAKAFCYANRAYGAESYVQGFSGYGIELLILYYKSFLGFVKAMAKVKDREIIDIEKQHKNKSSILMDLNSAKLQSPIILVDPTYKERNVLAALSYSTFRDFQKTCREFLKGPSMDFFRQKTVDLDKMKKKAKKNGLEFLLAMVSTDRQAGDIAGSKLLKFYKHLKQEMAMYFDIKATGFEYSKEKSARVFFVVRKKTDLVAPGPSVKDKKNAARFSAKHKTVFVKNGLLYAKLKVEATIKEFLENWADQNDGKLEDMDITRIDVIENQ